MKKILLSVAILASTVLSANALGFDFTSGGGVTKSGSTVTGLSSVIALSNATININGTACEVSTLGSSGSVATLTITGSGVSIAMTSTASAAIAFKVYDTYIVPNGVGRVLTITCNPGDVVVLTTLSYTSGSATLAITGADKSSVNLTASTQETTTLTASGSAITITNTLNKYELTKVSINGQSTPTPTSINDTKVDNGAVVKTEYFNVIGGFLGADANVLPNGIYIKKLTYENGAIVSSKTILRK